MELLDYNRVYIGVILLTSVFWWLNLVRLCSLYEILHPPKEDIVLLYTGYHSIHINYYLCHLGHYNGIRNSLSDSYQDESK